MSRETSQSDPERRLQARVIAVRGGILGFDVTLGCASCSAQFEGRAPQIAGLALGRPRCPQCGTEHALAPEQVVDALAAALPPFSPRAAIAVGEAATRAAESWHQVPAVAQVFRFKEIALGPPTERELAALFVRGIFRALLDRA